MSVTFRCVNNNNPNRQNVAEKAMKKKCEEKKPLLLRNSKCFGHNMTFFGAMLWLEHWLWNI